MMILAMLVACADPPAEGVEATPAQQPTVTDLGPGTVQAPDGFVALRTGTADSTMGTLTSPDGHFVVSYDIGGMAGTRAQAGPCDTRETLDAGGVPVFVCDTSVDGHRLVVATVGTAVYAGAHYPANFWANAEDDAQRDAVLAIATSYHPAKPTDTRQVWIPRGLGIFTDAGGSRFELVMEADPTLLEVTTGASMGHRNTWTRIAPDGTRSEELTIQLCGARLQNDIGPADLRDGATYAVEVVLFETSAPCTDPWDTSPGYRELHRVTID